MESCNLMGIMSLLKRNAELLRRLLIIIFKVKYGTARRLALSNPSPPLLVFRDAMRRARCGMLSSDLKSSIVLRKLLMMLSHPAGTGPFQLYQSLAACVVMRGKLCITSESKRCGRFCIVQWENNFSRVCRSGMALLRFWSALYTAVICSS